MALRNLFFFVSVLALVASCGEKDSPIDPVKPPTPPNPPVAKVSKKAQIDSINKLLKTIDRYKDVVRDSVWADSSGVTFFYNYSEQRIPVTPNNLAVSYPGAFVNMNELKNGNYKLLQGYPTKPIDIYSMSVGQYYINEKLIPDFNSINNLVNNVYKGALEKSNVAYIIAPFKRYEDAFLGAKQFVKQLKPAITLNVDSAVKTSRVLIINNGDADMYAFDDVGEYSSNPQMYQSLAGAGAYVQAVQYGYRITMVVESNESEAKLKDAVEHLLVKKNATSDDIQLLQQAKAYVYYNHPFAASISTENKNGYERLKECEDLLAKPYPKQGVPVYFFAKEIKATNSEDYKPAKTGSLDFSFRGQ